MIARVQGVFDKDEEGNMRLIMADPFGDYVFVHMVYKVHYAKTRPPKGIEWGICKNMCTKRFSLKKP